MNQMLGCTGVMMSALQIYLFGAVRIFQNQQLSDIKLTPTTQILLAYLLLNRHRSHSREVLIGVFWGDHSEQRARGCLSTALWRLRGALEAPDVPKGTYLLTPGSGGVAFNSDSDHWLDVAAFEEGVSTVIKHPHTETGADQIEKLQRALGHYTADLLEGVYEDWALSERERLRLLYLNGLSFLMNYHCHQHEYREAIACGQQILQHDPLREEIHRDLMRLYLLNGDRALAVRQYVICQDMLAEDLNILPMEETQALYHEITGPSGREARHTAPAVESADAEQAVLQFRSALRAFDAARGQLLEAGHRVEQLLAYRTAQGPGQKGQPLHKSAPR